MGWLLEVLFDFYVDAKRPVLIAKRHNRHIPVHVILHLNDLLLRRAHVRNIRNGQVARHPLFDGNARPGVLARARGSDARKPWIYSQTGDSE